MLQGPVSTSLLPSLQQKLAPSLSNLRQLNGYSWRVGGSTLRHDWLSEPKWNPKARKPLSSEPFTLQLGEWVRLPYGNRLDSSASWLCSASNHFSLPHRLCQTRSLCRRAGVRCMTQALPFSSPRIPRGGDEREGERPPLSIQTEPAGWEDRGSPPLSLARLGSMVTSIGLFLRHITAEHWDFVQASKRSRPHWGTAFLVLPSLGHDRITV